MPRIYSTSFERIIWLGQSAAKVDGFDNDAMKGVPVHPVTQSRDQHCPPFAKL
jgi:hypothetical protein